ncbi:MAG: ribonuclease P protein component [Gammaproteobacteria bacterium]
MPNIAPQYRFPRSARLLRQAEFGRVFAEGRRLHLAHFTLIAVAGTQGARLGLAIGKRSAARAVARNRLKRLAREAFRQAHLPPLDIVVTARPDAARSDGKTLHAELATAFETLKEQCAN